MQSTYNFKESYEWNYMNGPVFEGEFPKIPLERRNPVRLLGSELALPLGIPAGLLLNARWVDLYARLGFDLLTYKTVRTRQHPSLPPPNCLFVNTKGQITPERFSEKLIAAPRPWPIVPGLKPETGNQEPETASSKQVSITNSFGMPSQDPQQWQPDVERAKGFLHRNQLLMVSVVGTFEEKEGVEAFTRDFALCARLATEAGADIVELNLSCPNSCADEGALYTDPEMSGRIVQSVKREVGNTPLFLKVGFYRNPKIMERTVRVTAPFVQGIVGINTLKMEVINPIGQPALPGEGRQESGICGAGIRNCGLHFVESLNALKTKEKYDFSIVGVGGVFSPQDVNAFLERGANAVQTCTGAMFDPYLASVCRREI